LESGLILGQFKQVYAFNRFRVPVSDGAGVVEMNRHLRRTGCIGKGVLVKGGPVARDVHNVGIEVTRRLLARYRRGCRRVLGKQV
jgi:hypothetical protein